MNYWKIIVVGGALVCTVVPFAVAGSDKLGYVPTSPLSHRFVVFDGTLYRNKPDLSHYGIRPVKIVGGQLWDRGRPDEALPPVARVHRVAEEVAGLSSPVILDIEHWPLQGAAGAVEDSLSKYLTVLRWFRETRLDVTVGYYGTVPIRDYWRSIKEIHHSEYRAWNGENDRLRPLAAVVDVLFPSLYTFYDDREGWRRYAVAQIREARRIGSGKPVYVFLWPQFHDSNQWLRGKYLSPDFWRMELETARQYADGIVIWGGWGLDSRPERWDEDASWWKVTKDFLQPIN